MSTSRHLDGINMGALAKLHSLYDVILASSSPRRREILVDILKLDLIDTMKPAFEENLNKELYKNDPIAYVRETCAGKCDSILNEIRTRDGNGAQRPKLIVCADTVVVDRENRIYEKPPNKEVQLKNLLHFRNSGEPLRVITAVSIIKWTDSKEYKVDSFHEVSEVHFDPTIPEEVVKTYVESGDGLTAAGGFKVQGFSAAMINQIRGDYYNIVGLPANKTLVHLLNLV